MLKAILISVHGVRSKKETYKKDIQRVEDVAFELVPTEEACECR